MNMITIDRSIVQQALEALDAATSCIDGYYVPRGKTTLPEIEEAQKALRAALAQQDEPVQAISECIAVLRPMVKGKFPHEQALDELVGYIAPPQRKPLTKEEILRAFYAAEKSPMSIRHGLSVVESARIVERAHGIGETK